MLLLAIDTSGKQGGISLARCEGEVCAILESSPIAGGTFSAQLIPQVAEALNKQRLKPADLKALVVISGPGSFTGLRVGLAAAKGLAEALHLPIVSLSLLELMAFYGPEGRVLAVLDAGRGECYCGEYDVRGQQPALVREFLCRREELIKLTTSKDITIVFCEENVRSFLSEAGIPVTQIERPDSVSAVLPGLKKLLGGETIDVEQLDANYIRRSDAEIFSKPKLDAQKRTS
jgi:tRNA threonylcarbamoyladenosine biosynthesis protein TsaB